MSIRFPFSGLLRPRQTDLRAAMRGTLNVQLRTHGFSARVHVHYAVTLRWPRALPAKTVWHARAVVVQGHQDSGLRVRDRQRTDGHGARLGMAQHIGHGLQQDAVNLQYRLLCRTSQRWQMIHIPAHGQACC